MVAAIKEIVVFNHGNEVSADIDNISIFSMTEIIIGPDGVRAKYDDDLKFSHWGRINTKTKILMVGWAGRKEREPEYVGGYLSIVPVGPVYPPQA